MTLTPEDIQSLYERYGASLYDGEAVTQLAHALQAACLAETEHAPDALIVAALLHDLGHLLEARNQERENAFPGVDHRHQLAAVPFLQAGFPDSVIEPVKMHVDAKRCLCAIDPDYFGRLSPASVHSLGLQGGKFSQAQVEQFQQRPYAQDALRLRRWDDRAKVPQRKTPDLAHFMHYVKKVYQPAPVALRN
ncbi:MAG TPA: HD domain-containing protein [Advenella sp.]|nr:HD domain-containing protein [Advenella sp.]